jgi:hypothetical protein
VPHFTFERPFKRRTWEMPRFSSISKFNKFAFEISINLRRGFCKQILTLIVLVDLFVSEWSYKSLDMWVLKVLSFSYIVFLVKRACKTDKKFYKFFKTLSGFMFLF